MSRTFSTGGVHPPENKLSAGAAIERLPLPETVVVLLSQHIGAPALPVVETGTRVLAGQLVGAADGFVSANVHSPVSGTVVSVGVSADGAGRRVPAVTVRVEGDEWVPGTDLSEKPVKGCPHTPEEIVRKIAAAGIVGMGGAAFPTHVKLSPLPGKKARLLIINGAECEPGLTSDYRLMLEKSVEVLTGASILAKALGAEKTCVAVEDNKPGAIALLRAAAMDFLSIEVAALKTKYPQGGEKQLIDAVAGRRVPRGGLPIDVGVVVHNVGTAFAVYEAVQKNKPLVERVVTVTGRNIAKPSNFIARIGVPVSSLIEATGGMPPDAGKIVLGGTMMGRAVSNPGAPLTKAVSGIVVMDGREASRDAETACIKCGWCVSACPMGLEPYLLSKMSRKRMWDEAENNLLADCIECGCCAYLCPARIPLLDWMRVGKAEIVKAARRRAAAG